jgi:hypothetical protein
MNKTTKIRCKPADSGRRDHKDGLASVFPMALLIALLALGASAWAQSAAPSAGDATGFVGDSSVALSAGSLTSIPGATVVNAAVGVGTIEGVAVSSDGTVYEGVSVELEKTGANASVPVVDTTSSDGAFLFTNVPPGGFRLTLSSPGFVPQTVTGTLHADETYDAHEVVMTVATATSDVHVTASRADIAQADVNIEETQRVLGIVPNYFVAYDHDAPPMSARQKWQMTWRTDIDPVTFAATGLVAGFEQAENILPGYGQGAEGYAKRFGAGYTDTAINTFIGSAILPSLLKQDPRYFYKGTGSVKSRIWYALANTVICKGDNGRWQPNYSAVVGGLASGAISNLYYPSDNGWGVTFEGAAIGTAEGAIQNLFQEFVVKKLTPGSRKLPN